MAVSSRSPSPRALARALAAACLAGAAACGGGGGSAGGPAIGAAVFPVEPFGQLASDSGALQVTVWTSPAPPVKGTNSVKLRIADAAGAGVPGLAVTVVPWMPAHGHGGTVTPVVTDFGDGTFEVDSVNLYMSGHWELRTSITGAASDAVTPTVDIP